jgi:hypothetical protein
LESDYERSTINLGRGVSRRSRVSGHWALRLPPPWLLLLSSGAPSAFAGWTAVPTAPSPAAVKAARAACGRVASADVLAADQRGPYTAIVYQRGPKPTECVTDGRHVLLSQATLYPPRMFVSPGNGNVTLPIPERQWWSPHRLTAVSGTVGPGVTGVTLRLADAKSVAATVGHGWYLAWWPGSVRDNAYPTAIEITTRAGTHRASYGGSELHALFVGCAEGGQCREFMQAIHGLIDLVPGVPTQLIKHFRLFRTVSPHSVPSDLLGAHNLLRPQDIRSWGLDVPQARIVSFGRSGTVIVIPGSAGVCVAHPYGSGGIVSCQKMPLAWQQGTIGLGGGGGNGKGVVTYYVDSLVPDTNRTVTVRLGNGKTVVIPVKNNVAFGSFTVSPTQMIFKNAAGKRTTYP